MLRLLSMFILKPDQRILNILKRIREATVSELTIKAKIHQSKICSIFKQLKEQGRVKHRYLRDGYSQRYVKHYRLTGRDVK